VGNATYTQVFSSRLVGRRNELGWTQQELADKCGFALRSIQGWEKDGVIPRAARLRTLAQVMGVEPAYLTKEAYTRPKSSPATPGTGRETTLGSAGEDHWHMRAVVAESKLRAIRALLDEEVNSEKEEAIDNAERVVDRELEHQEGERRSHGAAPPKSQKGSPS
jgi:transcriptional regulator with XRE-family HTH domain